MKKLCSTEVGLLAIWDRESFTGIDLAQNYQDYFVNDSDILKLMNQGKIVVWGTGGDGDFSVSLKINPQEDLSVEEAKLVEMKSLNLKLTVTSGKLGIGSPEAVENESSSVNGTDQIEGLVQGNYLVNIYFLYDTKVMDMDESEVSENLKNNPDFDKTGYVVVLRSVDNNFVFPQITEVPQLG